MQDYEICCNCGQMIVSSAREKNMILIRKVAEIHNVTVDDMMGNGRTSKFVEARQEAFYALHKRGLSYSEIGRIMNRDHSTVMYGVRKYLDGVERQQRLNGDFAGKQN